MNRSKFNRIRRQLYTMDKNQLIAFWYQLDPTLPADVEITPESMLDYFLKKDCRLKSIVIRRSAFRLLVLTDINKQIVVNSFKPRSRSMRTSFRSTLTEAYLEMACTLAI